MKYGLPLWLHGKESARICLQCRRCGFSPWVGKLGRLPGGGHGNLLPGESHRQRNLVGHSPQGHKQSDTNEVTAHACNMKYIYLCNIDIHLLFT